LEIGFNQLNLYLFQTKRKIVIVAVFDVALKHVMSDETHVCGNADQQIVNTHQFFFLNTLKWPYRDCCLACGFDCGAAQTLWQHWGITVT
jgi:hypothetical protein